MKTSTSSDDDEIQRIFRASLYKMRASNTIPCPYPPITFRQAHKSSFPVLRKISAERAADQFLKCLPTSKDLDILSLILCADSVSANFPMSDSCSDNNIDDDLAIDYESFISSAARCSPSLAQYINAETYLMFPRDRSGCVSTISVIEWMRQSMMYSYVYALASKFSSSSNAIDMTCLKHSLGDIISQLRLRPEFIKLDSSYRDFYITYAAQRFFFFLDSKGRGRIKLKQLVDSYLMVDLLDLCREKLDSEDTNAFALNSFLELHEQFLRLDQYNKGFLTPADVGGFGSGTLTDIFISRVFEEYVPANDQMDYVSFLNMAFALQYRHSNESLKYFWKILDLDRKNYITRREFSFFFKEVAHHLYQMSYIRSIADGRYIADVVTEVFDMISPVVADRVTLTDVLKCGVGGTVMGILCDVTAFYLYDNRENLPHPPAPHHITIQKS